jgi:3'-5' exoribonuclease
MPRLFRNEDLADDPVEGGHLDIRDFAEGMAVEGCYARKEASLRETRTGGQFIRLTLGDASGEITGNIWDKTEDQYADIGEQYRDLNAAEVIKIRAAVESYRDALQLKVLRARPAEPGEIDRAVLMAATPLDRDELLAELTRLIEGMADEDWKALAHLFLDDEAFLEAFSEAPAARANHHAYLGGLLEHTVSILRLCDLYARQNTSLRRDLLLAGGLFHDIGKVEELRGGLSIEYTDEGTLMGHLMQGVLMIDRRLRESMPEFPVVKRNLLYHLILSHHGRHEYGSPVLPAIPEAFALHHIDNLDAKVFAANKTIAEDPDPTSNWTARSWMLETRLFKG